MRSEWATVAGVVSLIAFPRLGFAEEAPQEAPVAHAADEAFLRVDLGLGLPGANGAGLTSIGGGLGAAGGLTSSWIPTGEVTLELRAVGPLWFVGRAIGSYHTASAQGFEVARSWSVGGQAGVRVEVPLLDWLEAGGHVLLGGNVARSAAESYASSGYFVGGVVGASTHLRPTELFGVRLSLDILRAGHQSSSGTGHDASGTFIELTATPHLELTFSFE